MIGVLLAMSAVQVGFLSDDFLMVRYWDREAGSVRWNLVGAEFQGPWFGVRDLYRPLVSLSDAVQAALFGFDSRWFHLANVAMLLVSALSVGAIVRLRFPSAPGYLAAAAGSVMLLHPAAVEPAHWIAARTTGLEVMFSTLAMALYAAFLYGRLRSRWPAFVAMALALGSKEGAIMLAGSLTAIDLLCTRGSARARVMSLRPFWILLFAYLLFRKLVLGYFTTAKEGLETSRLWDGFWQHASWLLGPPGTVWAWLGALLLLVCCVVLVRVRPVRLGIYLFWIAALLVPTSHVASVGNAWDGRLVYHCLPPLALLIAEAASVLPQKSFLDRGLDARLLLGALLAGWSLAAWSQAEEYRRGGYVVTELRAALEETAEQCALGRPLGQVAFAQTDANLLLLQRKAWGLMLLKPFVDRDLPIVSLESLLPDGLVETVPVDGVPASAVVDAGGMLSQWADAQLETYGAPATAPPSELLRSGPGRYAAGSPWLPFAASVVEVELPQAAQECVLRLSRDLPALAALGERRAQSAEPQQRFWFDLSAALTPLTLAKIGLPWPELTITADGQPVPEGTTVRLRRRPEPMARTELLQGAELRLEDLTTRLSPPAAEATLHLLLPTTTLSVKVTGGAPWQLSEDANRELGFLRWLLGSATVHFCWTTGGGETSPRRSGLDWFTLR